MEQSVNPHAAENRRKGCLALLVLFGLYLVVRAIFGPGTDQAVRTNAGSQQSQPAAIATAPTIALYAIGQNVIVDQVRWRVLSAEQIGNVLHSDNQFIDDLTTTGTFIRIRVEIENLSNDMLTFGGFDLVDSRNREFTDASDAYSFIDDREECWGIENLNPNVPKVCTHIFAVAANATGLKAKLGDLKLLGSQEALVDLGF